MKRTEDKGGIMRNWNIEEFDICRYVPLKLSLSELGINNLQGPLQ